MAIKSFIGGKKDDIEIKRVTGKKIDYYASENAANRIQDPYLSFQYYAYGAGLGITQFYWHPDGGSITQLTNIVANGINITQFSGQQQTGEGQAWRNATINLSTYELNPGKLVVRHQASSSTSNFFTGDFQLDTIKLNCSNGQIIDLDPDLKRSSSIDNWQRGPVNTAYNSINTWTDVQYQEDNNSFWCYDNNGTGSTNTANPSDSDGSTTGYYLYTEVSGAASSYNHLRTKNSYNISTGALA